MRAGNDTLRQGAGMLQRRPARSPGTGAPLRSDVDSASRRPRNAASMTMSSMANGGHFALYCLLHQQNTPKTNNTDYSRRSREVVRGGLSGQRTDHNAHTQSTIPGYCTTGLVQATQRQGHSTARLTFVARLATATVRDTTPGALTARLVPSTHVLYSSG